MTLNQYHTLKPLPTLEGDLFVKAGARGYADPLYDLLAQHIEPFGQRATDLNPGVGLIVQKLLGAGLAVTAFETSKASIRCLEASFSTRIDLKVAAPWETKADTADLAVLALPANRGTRFVEFSLLGAAKALRMGGRLWISGSKDKGFERYFKWAQGLLGYGVLVAKDGPYRVAVLEKEKASPGLADPWQSFEADFIGQKLKFQTLPGVFSAEHIDPGTTLLLEQLPPDLGSVLDIGAGYGAISLPLAGRAERLTLLEDDLLSVQSAQRSLEINGLNAAVFHSDVDSSLTKAARFTTVITNPPFHVGGFVVLDTALAFLESANARLEPGGRFYVVANRFLPYEMLLEQLFAKVEVVAVGTHKVLLAYK